MKRLILIAFALFVSLCAFADDGRERILNYDSSVRVSEDGKFTVTETITVVSAGINIRRGIYRDFPLRYKDRQGRNYKVSFDLLSVKRDGKNEPYHTAYEGKSIRIYIGDSDVFIPDGEHTYEIIYETDRQMGFFKNFDEIYWNVNGNDWMFETEEITCRIYLPDETDMGRLSISGYTGYFGDTGQDYEYEVFPEERMVLFRSIRQFGSYEGMTVAIGFPKGAVAEPGPLKRAYFIIMDNRDILFSIFALICILIYFIYVWSKVGKDPARGTIIPLYEPPSGFSAGEMRYLMKMGYDNKVFVSYLVSLAVKGFVTIEEKKNKYIITKDESRKKGMLDEIENSLYDSLFSAGDSFTFESDNHLEVSSMISGNKNALYKKCHGAYFNNNTKEFAVGVIFSVAATVITFLLADKTLLDRYIFSTFIVAIAAVSISVLYFLAKSLKDIFSGKTRGSAALQTGCAFVVVLPLSLFGIIAFMAFSNSSMGFTIGSNVIIIMLLFVNILFYRLMKAPTVEGRKVMDRIESFKMFLMTTEREKIYLYNPPKVDQRLFESFLPYAIALDADYQWVDSFERELVSDSGEMKRSALLYHPVWYSGKDFNLSNFKSSFASDISSSVSRSSAAPGSSSGSSGGGSSGGGGGGGGGGGW